MKKLRSDSSRFNFVLPAFFAKPLFIEIRLLLINAFHVEPLNITTFVIAFNHLAERPTLAGAVQRLRGQYLLF